MFIGRRPETLIQCGGFTLGCCFGLARCLVPFRVFFLIFTLLFSVIIARLLILFVVGLRVLCLLLQNARLRAALSSLLLSLAHIASEVLASPGDGLL